MSLHPPLFLPQPFEERVSLAFLIAGEIPIPVPAPDLLHAEPVVVEEGLDVVFDLHAVDGCYGGEGFFEFFDGVRRQGGADVGED